MLCIWDLVVSHIFMWHIKLYFLQNLLARSNKHETVLNLIVICEEKVTIKNSNKIHKFLILSTHLQLKEMMFEAKSSASVWKHFYLYVVKISSGSGNP